MTTTAVNTLPSLMRATSGRHCHLLHSSAVGHLEHFGACGSSQLDQVVLQACQMIFGIQSLQDVCTLQALQETQCNQAQGQGHSEDVHVAQMIRGAVNSQLHSHCW